MTFRLAILWGHARAGLSGRGPVVKSPPPPSIVSPCPRISLLSPPSVRLPCCLPPSIASPCSPTPQCCINLSSPSIVIPCHPHLSVVSPSCVPSIVPPCRSPGVTCHLRVLLVVCRYASLSHTLQPGFGSLLSLGGPQARWSRSEPIPSLHRHCRQHRDQVTPGPARNELGGHSTVRQGCPLRPVSLCAPLPWMSACSGRPPSSPLALLRFLAWEDLDEQRTFKMPYFLPSHPLRHGATASPTPSPPPTLLPAQRSAPRSILTSPRDSHRTQLDL